MNSRFEILAAILHAREKKKKKEFKRKEIVLKDSRRVTIGFRRNGEKIIWIKGK